MSDTMPRSNDLPRTPLIAIGVLLVAVIVGVAAVRLSGQSIRVPDGDAVATRALRFEDRPDGSIAVIDGRSGVQLDSVQGEAGFLRGALRALARERMKRGLGPEQAFELVARNDGRLTLMDPATGERIDLESFGPTNAGVFARLLNVEPQQAPAR
ncbi:photosynthetic complex assembly protein PuhC [Rubrivivax gelatinosus]|uniref:Putative photosynthetic complex assembly protein n=1 Tax=Rubrivivax gelatinosus TaxID=28068 RepID=A0A4R2MLN1_RUBGE|nr:photosynthetic complex assembly protein PuhC [Rubrivivax gelatinosus]MBK1686049.1 photosynthetic complex assembly protein PuhC [Rubrivivax gelatinosus]TCP03926.1 putative photosynthetic complex assembly protein [Rubrivivax gelatinosus]